MRFKTVLPCIAVFHGCFCKYASAAPKIRSTFVLIRGVFAKKIMNGLCVALVALQGLFPPTIFALAKRVAEKTLGTAGAVCLF